METLETLSRRIESIRSLGAVVRTMKALAAVSIRQYEEATAALLEYRQTIELGLRATLRGRLAQARLGGERAAEHLGAFIFGTDLGMCGGVNDELVSFALEKISEMGPESVSLWACGARAGQRLAESGAEVDESFDVPGSVFGITAAVEEILLYLDGWRDRHRLYEIHFFYNRARGGGGVEPADLQVLPVSPEWLQSTVERPWPTRTVPLLGGAPGPLYSRFVQQYLFASGYLAFVESLRSENQARLRAMQAAERNVEEKLDALQFLFHQSRQSAITGELLDVLAGFEALR